jgi:hypothetical protein
MPQGGKAQESQGAVRLRNRPAVTSTGRGIKPLKRGRLSAAMPHAPKARLAPLIREGPALTGRAEEPIPADGQSRGGANAVGFMSD